MVDKCPTTYGSDPLKACIPSTYRPSTAATIDGEANPAKTGSQNRSAAIAASVVVVVGVVGGGLGVGLFLYYRRRRSNNNGNGGKGEEENRIASSNRNNNNEGGNVAMVELKRDGQSNEDYIALGNNTNNNYNRDSTRALQGKLIDIFYLPIPSVCGEYII